MGVRIREELRQALQLNNSSHAQKKVFLENLAAHNKKKHVDGNVLDSGIVEKAKKIPVQEQ